MRTIQFNHFYRRVLLALLLAGTSSVSGVAGEPQLMYHDFRDAIQQARADDLPILVHFYTQWCGPCRTMDQTVFRSSQLRDALAGKLILVKVDAEQSPDLAKMYQVSQYPTDVFLDPDGRILSTSSGAMSLSSYIGYALQVEGRYQQSKRVFSDRKNSGNDPSPTASFEVSLGQAAPFPRELLGSNAGESKTNTSSENDQASPGPSQIADQKPEKKAELVFIALDGFCSVKLNQDRSWVRGNKKLVLEYRQQQYYFSGKEQRDLFEKDPQIYAPRLLGCDPVIMWESDRAIPGSTEFAAYCNDKLYLFTSEENRELFQIDPERYTNTRHVLVPRHIEATLFR